MNRYAIAVLALAQAADLATTGYGLGHGGKEVNPLMLAVLAAGGLGLLALVKVGTVVTTVLISRLHNSRAVTAAIWGGAVLMFTVAVSNVAAVGGL